MAQISYETEEAVLTFGYRDAVEVLSASVRDHHVEDDSTLLKWLEDNSKNGQRDVAIDSTDELEMDDCVTRIVYVIKDLLLKGKGVVFCKECDRHIPASEIRKDQTTPFDAHKGLDKKTIKRLKKELGIKGRPRLSGLGGTTFFCNKGHELFGTRDWVS